MEVKQHTGQQEEEISLKELIIKIQEWWRYLLSKWVIILVFGLIGIGLGLTYSLLRKPDYVAELTFVLEENKGNPLGAYAGLASQFGIDLGNSSGVGVFAGENILEFLRSRLMVEKTLLSPVQVGGKTQSLAELYIDAYELRKGWQKTRELQNIRLPYNTDRSSFSRQQDSILNILYQRIIKGNLAVDKLDKKLSFIIVRCITGNETLSKILTERLVREATDFYVTTKTKRSKTNVDILQEKADSIEQLLNRKTYSAAASQDLNRNPARMVATVGAEVASRDKIVLQTIYGEVIKNLELSRMAMAQETPVIQIVDAPILPLKKERTGKFKGMLIGGFLGGFLIVLALLLKELFRQIMK